MNKLVGKLFHISLVFVYYNSIFLILSTKNIEITKNNNQDLILILTMFHDKYQSVKAD